MLLDKINREVLRGLGQVLAPGSSRWKRRGLSGKATVNQRPATIPALLLLPGVPIPTPLARRRAPEPLPFAIRNREWDKTVRKLPPTPALILKTWGKPSAPT